MFLYPVHMLVIYLHLLWNKLCYHTVFECKKKIQTFFDQKNSNILICVFYFYILFIFCHILGFKKNTILSYDIGYNTHTYICHLCCVKT
jgi:hypothetical protein